MEWPERYNITEDPHNIEAAGKQIFSQFPHLQEFYDLAKSLEIDCLVEVHNEKELKKVVACGCDIIGINNRNLKTFDVDLNTTSKLAPLIPYEAVLVSESGMKDENDMKNVKEQGADAVLIGETFMRSDNIKETMKQLRSCL